MKTLDVAGTVQQLLAEGEPATCAAALLAVVADENEQQAGNALLPYADLLPPLLAGTPPERVAEVFREFTGPQVVRLLFGSFRQLPWSWLDRLAVVLDEDVLVRLLRASATGVDAPRQGARLLAARAAADGGQGLDPLRRLPPAVAARLAGLVPLPVLVTAFASSAGARPDWWGSVEQEALPPETVRLRTALTSTEVHTEPTGLGVPGHVTRLEQLPVEEALQELLRHGSAWRLAVLGGLPAALAAKLLGRLADRDPAETGLLLGGLSEWPLVEGPAGLTRTLFRARAAAVLRAAPAADRARLLALVDRRVHQALSARASGHAPAAYPQVHVRSGTRRARRLDDGLRLVELREQVETPDGPVPLRVDLLELDPARVGLRVCRGGEPVSFTRLVDEGNATGRGGARPDEQVFRRLGMIRLADVLAPQGACAGINGNFYLDYGHYLDGLDLGLDLAAEPHVLLGDTIGWFVSDGRELAPPLVHRATLLVTEDGAVSLRRVFARAADVAGREHLWDRVDTPGPGRVLYTRLYGAHTPLCADVVELTVSGGVVVDVGRGGGSRIPLLGFVLTVPADQAGGLDDVPRGERVGLPANLSPGSGRVVQAMSCGPLLVRDGEVDLDLALEGFGDKDTGVLPLSLTRAVDSFRAARSFLFTRGGTVVLGTVSGTQVGMGPVEVSAGVTFGELAQLCADLGADDAMALDGGGSSALVARTSHGPTLLNVPTGGSDVPPGSERFLSTYLLGVPRSGR